MILVLIEDPLIPIVSNEIKEKFPSNCRMSINQSTKYKELEKLKDSPLLTKKWYVDISKNVNKILLSKVLIHDNINIVRTSASDYKETLAFCSKYGECKFINALRLDRDSIRTFICSELNVDSELGDFLYERCNGYTPSILESVTLLKSLSKEIKKSDITKYVKPTPLVNVKSLFLHIMGVRRIKQKSLVLFLYNFRYAIKYLKTELLNLFNVVIKLYNDLLEGKLDLSDIKGYVSENKLKVSDLFVIELIDNVVRNTPLENIYLLRYKILQLENTVELLNFI